MTDTALVEQPPAPPPAPAARRSRLEGVDVARGLAVLGMVGAHVGVVAELQWGDPTTWSGVVHGRPSILFALLAGVSLALLTGGSRPLAGGRLRDVRLRLVARAGYVFAVGIVLELLATGVSIILPLYGVLFLVALPALGWPTRRLWCVSAVLALAGPAVLAAVTVLTGGAGGPGSSLVLFGSYPITVWSALVLAGIGVGRLRLDRVRTAAGLLVVGAVVAALGYGSGALVGPSGDGNPAVPQPAGPELEEVTTVPGAGVDLSGSECLSFGDGSFSCAPTGVLLDDPVDQGIVTAPATPADRFSAYLDDLAAQDALDQVRTAALGVQPHSGGTPELLGSGGLAVAVLGACLLLARPLRWLLLPVAAVGSMPLSAYAAHVVVIWVLVGTAGVQTDNGLWFWLSAGLLAGCTAWRLLIGRGPLEQLAAQLADRAAPRGRTDAPA